jgi:UDP-N-acetylmuramate dehydrogenase
MIEEQVPLASLTTLRIGGSARFAAACHSLEDVKAAIALAQDRGLPFRVVGGGSNILASDDGFPGVALLMRADGIEEVADKGGMLLIADAGASWDGLVARACARGLWGLENLAGIPGTVGAAPVQNIGAYGAEAQGTLAWVEAYDLRTGETRRFASEECGFGYRESRFKHDRDLVILHVAFRLGAANGPDLAYKDLARARDEGAPVATPEEVSALVRAIRARKFPDLAEHGTAGSFFKNPVVASDAFARLAERHPELPGFPQESGVKIPLAFVLDRVLGLRGHRLGRAWLFDKQPLVLVVDQGATAREVDALADEVVARVREATGIEIEREVQRM